MLLRATVFGEHREWSTLFFTQDIMITESGGFQTIFQQPILMPPKTDIKISAEAVGTAGGTVSGSFELIHGKTIKTQDEDRGATHYG